PAVYEMFRAKLDCQCTQTCRSRKVQLTAAAPTVAGSHAFGNLIMHPVQPVITLCNSASRRQVTGRASATQGLPADRGIDVVGFGNLCVDTVLPWEQLPPANVHVRRQLLDTLTSSPPHHSYWEVGGNCNFMVAAARLGLRVASVGHIGTDVYGNFMDNVLRGIRTLPGEAMEVLRTARAVFTNGFIFDELPLAAVETACSDAIEHGAAIFFDPGPRCQTMLEGPRRAALNLLLDLSSVVLMTEEEARVVTGLDDPQAAAEWVLARPGARAQWVVIKMGSQGALLCERNRSNNGSSRSSGGGAANGQGNGRGHGCDYTGAASSAETTTSPAATARVTRLGAVKVEVVDTVGCGDSFAAAVVMGYISGWPADVTLALANAVGGATATGRGAGRNVAQLERVLALLAEGAAGAADTAACGPEAAGRQRVAFARARALLLQSLESRRPEQGNEQQGGREEGRRQEQLSAAA
ncbi:hypothetical protein VOLCADRAFT_119122, partial [Volvox carteri f. nagariensis]